MYIDIYVFIYIHVCIHENINVYIYVTLFLCSDDFPPNATLFLSSDDFPPNESFFIFTHRYFFSGLPIICILKIPLLCMAESDKALTNKICRRAPLACL